MSSLTGDALESSDDLDPREDGVNEPKEARKKKNKRRKGTPPLVMHFRVEGCVSFQMVAPFPLSMLTDITQCNWVGDSNKL